jgi:hypothetical protein
MSVLSALTWGSALVSHWFVGWLFSPICRFLDDLGGGRASPDRDRGV